MSKIEELAAAIQAAMAQIATGRAALLEAAEPFEDAGRAYAHLGKGSTRPAMAECAAHLRTAYTSCREAVAMLDQAIAHLNTYLTLILGTPTTPTASPPPPPPPEPWRLTSAQVEKLRRELPPPITPAERGAGRKTHGRWVGSDGVAHPIVSGEDVLEKAAGMTLNRLGYKDLYIATHVEMKLACYLRQQRDSTGTPRHATIVLNNEPCRGRLSCETVLPVMLPEGCSLTVYAPNYRRTFTGGAVR